MLRDTEYWQNIVKDLTPFEESSLVEAIELCRIGEQSAFGMNVKNLTYRQLKGLVIQLASLHSITEILDSINTTNWCADGRNELTKLLRDRKKYLDSLNNPKPATA